MTRPNQALQDVRVFDDILPESLFTKVRDHAIELRDRMASLGLDSTKASFWFARDRAPRNLFENAIQHYMARIEFSPNWVGTEYWLYFSDGEKVFLPHFDKDESRWSTAREACIPLHTSVLYLTPNGAPTVVFDVTPEQLENDRTCWMTAENMAIWPIANRLLAMPGLTFHGVIPPRDMDPADKRGRATLLAASWDRKPDPPGCEEPEGALEASLIQRIQRGSD